MFVTKHIPSNCIVSAFSRTCSVVALIFCRYAKREIVHLLSLVKCHENRQEVALCLERLNESANECRKKASSQLERIGNDGEFL